MKDIHANIRQYAKAIVPVGSRVTCDPPPHDTDQDYLVLANHEGDLYELLWELDEDAYIKGGSEIMAAEDEADCYGEFSSYKKIVDGVEINYIVTNSQSFFDGFVRATNIAKKVNLLHKISRVALFQQILYDNGEVYNLLTPVFGDDFDWKDDNELGMWMSRYDKEFALKF